MARSNAIAAPDWLEQASQLMKSWNEQGQNAYQTWAETLKKSQGTFGSPTSIDAAGPLSQMTELINKSVEQWSGLAQWPGKEAGGVDVQAIRKLFDPAEWGRAGTSGFDLAIEHLTEGPTYATLWDIDRKLLNLQKLSQQRMRDIAAYQSILQDAWRLAGERFFKAIADASASPIKNARDFLDLWIATANDTLVEIHRTPRFLEAQRNVTRSSVEFRLAEREIAEMFCEVHHIPTRSEVDELQKSVIELRREVRALKAASAPRASPATRATVKTAATKTGSRVATAKRRKEKR